MKAMVRPESGPPAVAGGGAGLSLMNAAKLGHENRGRSIASVSRVGPRASPPVSRARPSRRNQLFSTVTREGNLPRVLRLKRTCAPCPTLCLSMASTPAGPPDLVPAITREALWTRKLFGPQPRYGGPAGYLAGPRGWGAPLLQGPERHTGQKIGAFTLMI